MCVSAVEPEVEMPITSMVKVPLGVSVFPPPLLPAFPPPPHDVRVIPKHTSAVSAQICANFNGCRRRDRYRHTVMSVASKPGIRRRFMILRASIPGGIPNAVRAFVVTVTTEVPEPFGRDAGAKLQLAAAGNLAQESATLPPNVPAGVTVMVDVAEAPDVTVAGESAEAEMEKSGASGGVIFSKITTPAVDGWGGVVAADTSKARSGRLSPLKSATKRKLAATPRPPT